MQLLAVDAEGDVDLLEAIYNRDTADTEMREAFQAWSTHVDELVRAHERAKFWRFRPKPQAPAP